MKTVNAKPEFEQFYCLSEKWGVKGSDICQLWIVCGKKRPLCRFIFMVICSHLRFFFFPSLYKRVCWGLLRLGVSAGVSFPCAAHSCFHSVPQIHFQDNSAGINIRTSYSSQGSYGSKLLGLFHLSLRFKYYFPNRKHFHSMHGETLISAKLLSRWSAVGIPVNSPAESSFLELAWMVWAEKPYCQC